MKRSAILCVIAVLLAVFVNPVCLVLLLVVVANEYYRRHHSDDEVKPYEKTVDDLTAEYGEPEDVILLNATRANEALGVILVYKDYFIVEGRRIEKGDITGVTFNNSGTPYAPGEYQVIIAVGPRQGDYIHINTGYDAAWTSDVVDLIKSNLAA